ncbi:Disco-interacting protein 2 protein C [Fasciola hepatica]|uniref:Disco-interacting protein 2 protein C n=1 Tax=Fasciola hepatica TaxID=6192 RepID=A0A4E0RVU7_FASHE|nr:Disco-interacting protein 2 protein C [Fasciola hepatica]
MLLNKLGPRGEQSLKPRDRVALIYANNEPISFLSAFYGCILASVVPIAIEVPSARRDASCQSMGFLLSSQDARIVLASEQCYKALQRGPNGDIASYPGWPRVTWINTDHHGAGTKPPRDWVPPERLPNEDTMYMEYTFTKDGSVHGVMISRRAALAHCRALTAACNYSEEDVVVCVVDCRRETGLWHAVLTVSPNAYVLSFSIVRYFRLINSDKRSSHHLTRYVDECRLGPPVILSQTTRELVNCGDYFRV